LLLVHRAFCDCLGASVQHTRDLTLIYGTRRLLGMTFVARQDKKWILLSQSSLQTSNS